MTIQDVAGLGAALTLIDPLQAADLSAAITGDPALDRTIDGASTLTFDVADYGRVLTNAGVFDQRSFAKVAGVRFELVSVSKRGDVVTLTMEDTIVAALRRRDSPLKYDADTLTRSEAAKLLAAEAGVAISVDPSKRELMHNALERSQPKKDGTPGDKQNSWSILGSLASEIGWRCFSDGDQLLFGSDDWLMSRLPAISIAEYTGAVQGIDYELDVGQDTSTAEVTVDVDLWTLPPGLAVDVANLGPASGRWLVEKYSRPLLRQRGTLSLVRGQPSLAEPAPTDDSGEAGELDYLADPLDTAPLPVSASANALEHSGSFSSGLAAMLTYALNQVGKKYVWGASGPNSFDCSGLVQQSTAAGGHKLNKPASGQLAQCQRGAGRMISVGEGLKTRGALLFRVDYPGEGDHVAISLGDGTTMEAHGAATGCGIFPNAAKRKWNAAAIVNFSNAISVGTTMSGPR